MLHPEMQIFLQYVQFFYHFYTLFLILNKPYFDLHHWA